MEYEKLKPLLSKKDGVVKAIEFLKEFEVEGLDIKALKSQWSPKFHAVNDKVKRPDRRVLLDIVGDDGQPTTREVIEPVTRIAIPMQKNIVGKAVTFLFGNPVEIKAETEVPEEINLLNAVKKVLEDNKVDSQNRVIAKNLFKSTQVVEIWWAEQSERHEDYGFSSDVRLRMSVFSPWDGSSLYPYYAPNGDMIAFSREFRMKDETGQNANHFEVYTVDEYILWAQKLNAGWEEVKRIPNAIKKLPLVYAAQEEAEWADVQAAIERLEKILSNHGDTNDYNGSPMIVTHGKIESFGKKGETGKLIEIEKDGNVEYMSWDSAPESIKMEIENCFKIILAYTQTPDISFESIKGMTSISGIALRFLFLDAHLKVMDKREVFDPYLKRRNNIVKAMLAEANSSFAKAATKLNIKNEITPFTVRDLLEEIQVLTEANGGLAVMSQEASFALGAFTNDPASDYKKFLAEEKERNLSTMTEPTF